MSAPLSSAASIGCTTSSSSSSSSVPTSPPRTQTATPPPPPPPNHVLPETMRLFIELCEASKPDLQAHLHIKFALQCERPRGGGGGGAKSRRSAPPTRPQPPPPPPPSEAPPSRPARDVTHVSSNDMPESMFAAAVHQLTHAPGVFGQPSELYTRQYYADGLVVWRRGERHGRLRETRVAYFDANMRLPGHDDKACLVAQMSVVRASYPEEQVATGVRRGGDGSGAQTSVDRREPPFAVRHFRRRTFVIPQPTAFLVHCDELVSPTPTPTSFEAAAARHSTPDDDDDDDDGRRKETTLVLRREISAETVSDRAWQYSCARNAVEMVAYVYAFLEQLERTSVTILGMSPLRLPNLIAHLHSSVTLRGRHAYRPFASARLPPSISVALPSVPLLPAPSLSSSSPPNLDAALSNAPPELAADRTETQAAAAKSSGTSDVAAATQDDRGKKERTTESEDADASDEDGGGDEEEEEEDEEDRPTENVRDRAWLVDEKVTADVELALRVFQENRRGLVEFELSAGRLVVGVRPRRTAKRRAPLSPVTESPDSVRVAPSPSSPTDDGAERERKIEAVTATASGRKRAREIPAAATSETGAVAAVVLDEVGDEERKKSVAESDGEVEGGNAKDDSTASAEENVACSSGPKRVRTDNGPERRHSSGENKSAAKTGAAAAAAISEVAEKPLDRVADGDEEKGDARRTRPDDDELDGGGGFSDAEAEGEGDGGDSGGGGDDDAATGMSLENGLTREQFFRCLEHTQTVEANRDPERRWYVPHAPDEWVDSVDYYLRDAAGAPCRATLDRELFAGRPTARRVAKRYAMKYMSKQRFVQVDYELAAPRPRPRRRPRRRRHGAPEGSGTSSVSSGGSDDKAKKEDDGDGDGAAQCLGFGIRASASGEYPRPSPFPLAHPRTAVRVKRRLTLVRRDQSALQVSFSIVKIARGPRCSVFEATCATPCDTSYEIEVEVPSNRFNRERSRVSLMRDATLLLCDILQPVVDVRGVRSFRTRVNRQQIGAVLTNSLAPGGDTGAPICPRPSGRTGSRG